MDEFENNDKWGTAAYFDTNHKYPWCKYEATGFVGKWQ